MSEQTVEERVVDELHYLDDGEECVLKLIKYAKDYASKRVLEELERLSEDTDGNDCLFLLNQRIKELKT